MWHCRTHGRYRYYGLGMERLTPTLPPPAKELDPDLFKEDDQVSEHQKRARRRSNEDTGELVTRFRRAVPIDILVPPSVSALSATSPRPILVMVIGETNAPTPEYRTRSG